MKTIRPEKKTLMGLCGQRFHLPHMHIARATEKGYIVTIPKKDNELLSKALQKQDMANDT